MERNLSNIKERVLYYTDIMKLSKEKFFEELGVTYGNFKGRGKEQALSSDFLERFVSKYTNINIAWLITGKGDMLKSEEQIITNSGDGNHNINNNGGNVTISKNDVSTMIELQKGYQDIQKELTERLKVSQDQINTLLEILKSKK